MAVLLECVECGKEYNKAAGSSQGVCLSCDILARSLAPPAALQEMQAVFAGQEPASSGQRLLKAMMEKNPDRFLARLEEAEAKWREQVARVTAGPVKESEEAVGDGQSERVEDLIEELLAEGTS